MRIKHELGVRVYYEDVDLAGIVYYANYLKFIERGRTELIRELGIDQKLLRENNGLVFVVRSLEAEYLKPAKFDDFLMVSTEINSISGARIQMEQKLFRQNNCLFHARVTLTLVNNSGVPRRMPSFLASKLTNHSQS